MAALRRLSGLPPFGIFAGTVWLLSFATCLGFSGSILHTPVGLYVHLLRPDFVRRQGPGLQPVLVTLRFVAAENLPELYVGSNPVTWNDFQSKLSNELESRPPDWPVYVRGDRRLEWQWPVRVIDAIRRQHVEMVLLAY